MYVKSAHQETNTDRRIDAAIAHLDRIAAIHRRRWLTGKVIWFPNQRARAGR